MKLSSVFSYADIVDMRNEGLNDDEIIQRAKAKVVYQNSPEYQEEQKAQEIEAQKRKDLERNFANYGISNQDQANLMSGRNTTGEIASKYRANIQNYEEKQIYKNQAENLANSKQKQIASAIDTMGGGLGEVATGVAKGATFIPHTIAKFLANNTDSELAKSFYEKSKSARSNLDKAQELYNARTGQDGSLLYKTGEIATEIAADPLTYWMPWMNARKFAARGAGYALTGGAEGALHEYGSNEKASAEDIAKMGNFGALLGLGGGALIEGAIKGGGALYNKYKSAKGASDAGIPNAQNAPEPNTQTAQNAPEPNAQTASMNENLIKEFDDDLATNGSWIDGGNTPPPAGLATPPKTAEPAKPERIVLKTADDESVIDLVPDENRVNNVVFNGTTPELTKIASEIGRGEIKSAGAKKLMAIAENSANEVANEAEQIISANIAKINENAIEFYANNINILNEVAKKYPMLSKSEQIELANKRILQNASPELLAYTRAINGGELPSDARLFGTNAGRMVAKSLEVGATPAEVRDMLLKANIKGELATALAKQLQTRDIAAFGDSMRASEQKLLSQSVQSVRSAARNESVGKILDDAKEQAIKNDEMLKKGVGNQGLDDEITTFKSEKSGKEFEVAENGFGRELMRYESKEASEDMKRSFSAWEAQGDKADITLNDGRKVVYLSPDEAVELSYGNGYLYGEKDLGALFARKKAESLEQRVERLQSHPAYENLLKMRENTKASELKGDTVGGSKPTVYYEPQSERYLRTKGGGGLPNGERSISITKADVAKLRAGKVDDILATKLENSLEALTGDPYASGLVDHLLTRDFHLGTAEYKKRLIAQPKKSAWQENFEEIHGIKKDEPNSRISSDEVAKTTENTSDFNPSGSWKAGYTSIKGKSATGNSRISDEVADDSVKKIKAKIETDPAKVKNSIGAIFGDSIDEKASKAIIKAVEEADGLDAKKFAFKKGILENTTKPFEVKGKPYEVSDKSAFKLREDLKSLKGTKLYHSGVEFVVGSRFTGRVSGAEAKAYSAKNNFSEVEHLTIANNIKEVFENSTFIAKRKGFKDRDRANNLFFISDVAIKNGDEVKQSRALITLKESLDDKGKRVYSIELDIAPSNIKGGEVPNAKSEIQPVNVEVATNHTSPENLAKNSSANEIKSQGEIKSTGKMPEISAGSKIKDEIFKNFMADEKVVQAAIVNDFENFSLFAKNKLDDLLVDAYEKNPDETRKLFDNVIGEFEPALNEFHKIAQSGELGAAKKTITQKQDLGKWTLDEKAISHLENTLNTNAGGIKKQYADDLAKIDELNLGDEVKSKLKEMYEKFLSGASDRVKKSRSGKVAFHHKKWGDATELEAFRTKLFNENSTTSNIKSQELAIRESFSPELKASYDMRDKLLKSTSEVRASLSDKGKAELAKLKESKDSKLSRDAQIMQTLENAKSDPARYEKLKKMYLDENGNIKDSIGLC